MKTIFSFNLTVATGDFVVEFWVCAPVISKQFLDVVHFHKTLDVSALFILNAVYFCSFSA